MNDKDKFLEDFFQAAAIDAFAFFVVIFFIKHISVSIGLGLLGSSIYGFFRLSRALRLCICGAGVYLGWGYGDIPGAYNGWLVALGWVFCLIGLGTLQSWWDEFKERKR